MVWRRRSSVGRRSKSVRLQKSERSAGSFSTAHMIASAFDMRTSPRYAVVRRPPRRTRTALEQTADPALHEQGHQDACQARVDEDPACFGRGLEPDQTEGAAVALDVVDLVG